MKRKIIIILLLFLAIILFAGKGVEKKIVEMRLDSYMNEKYEIDITVEKIDHEGTNKKTVYAMDEQGIKFCAVVDALGSIKEESYANYYYSKDGNGIISSIISKAYNGEYLVVKNLVHNLDLGYYLIEADGLKSYDDYSNRMKDVKQYYYVYLHKEPSEEELESILTALSQSELDDNISVIINYAPEELYEAHKGLTAYLLDTDNAVTEYCKKSENIGYPALYFEIPYGVAVYNYSGSTEILK